MRDVGIVMPVYKQVPEYLKVALRSILNQSYRHFYLVIVSDGAPEETIEIMKNETKGDNRVHFIFKEQNEGVAKALNTGFDFLMLKNEVKYLTWVSSDNKYYYSFIEKLRKELVNAPSKVGLSYSSFLYVDSNGNPLNDPQFKEFSKYQNQPKENLLDVCFIGVSFMYKKDVTSKIDGYRLEPVEDYDYWLRITEYCDIIYIPEVLMEYRTDSPLSISSKLKNSQSEHRRWRYAFHLARHEARTRRNIPFQLTVIFPVTNGFDKIVRIYEKLLDQTFSNYKLIIVDRSISKTAINVLKHISHPTVTFVWLPGVGEKEAIIEGVKHADTKFSMVLGDTTFPSAPYVLNSLIDFYNHMLQQGRNTTISTYDIGEGNIAFREEVSNEPMLGHVYLTRKLLEVVNIPC